MQFSLERSASFLAGEKVCKNAHQDEFVPRRIENLELPCRYSIVYELTRIEYMLNVPGAAFEQGAQWMMSISA